MRARIGLTVLAAVFLGLAAAAYWAVGELPTDPREIEAFVERAGIWAPIAYVALFALVQPFGFPGIVLIAAAAMAWSLPVTFILSWLGAIGAALVACGLARLFGRAWIESRLPERLRAYDQHLAERPLRTVVVLRLVFFLMPLAHWFLGLSRVGVVPLTVGSAIGFIPGMVFITFAGGTMLDWMFGFPAWAWLLVAAAGAIAIYVTRRTRLRAPVSAPAPAIER